MFFCTCWVMMIISVCISITFHPFYKSPAIVSLSSCRQTSDIQRASYGTFPCGIFYFSRYPDWKEVAANEMNVRPPQHRTDDALYIDDDDVTFVKTEEWEGRPVFVKSSKPCLSTPVQMTISSDSESDSEGLTLMSEDHGKRRYY